MSIVSRLNRMFRSLERRFGLTDLDAVMDQAIDGYSVSSGMMVNDETAMKVTAVYCMTKIIAETIASVPLKVFEELDDGKRVARQHPLYDRLHTKPNRRQTSYEWRLQMGCHLALKGNHYSEIIGEELKPLNPDAVTPVILENGEKAYEEKRPGGITRVLLAGEVLHLQTLSHTGLKGLSIIGLFRDAIGLSLASEEHGNQTLKNGARPSGALKHDKRLKGEALDNLRDSFKKSYSGTGNAGKPIILEEGMEWQQIAFSAEDMQFIESRKFQISEFARISRIPAHMLGDLEHATFSNVEHLGQQFVTFTMLPWFVNLEQRMTVDLLSAPDQRRYFVAFVVDGLQRGDLKTRYEAYAIGRQNGWLNANMILRKENENSIGPQGDVFTIQVNMVDLAQLPAISKKLAEPGPQPAAGTARALTTHVPLLERELERLIRKESSELLKGLRKHGDDPDKLARFTAEFYERFAPDLEDSLLPVLRSLDELTQSNIDVHRLAEEMSTRHVLDSRYLLEKGDTELNWRHRASQGVAAMEEAWNDALSQ